MFCECLLHQTLADRANRVFYAFFYSWPCRLGVVWTGSLTQKALKSKSDQKWLSVSGKPLLDKGLVSCSQTFDYRNKDFEYLYENKMIKLRSSFYMKNGNCCIALHYCWNSQGFVSIQGKSRIFRISTLKPIVFHLSSADERKSCRFEIKNDRILTYGWTILLITLKLKTVHPKMKIRLKPIRYLFIFRSKMKIFRWNLRAFWHCVWNWHWTEEIVIFVFFAHNKKILVAS